MKRDYHSTFGVAWKVLSTCSGITVENTPACAPGKMVCPSGKEEQLVYQRLDIAYFVISSVHGCFAVGGKLLKNWQPHHSSPV